METVIEWWRTADRAIFLALNGDGGAFADGFFWTMSHIYTWIPFYIFLGWMLYRRFGWRKMLLAVALIGLGVIVADQVANIFKYGVGKLRPTHNPALEGLVHTVRGYRGGLYGTVSAHAASSVAIALFISLIYRRWWIAVGMFAWAAVVSYSRIYLGVHYPADIFFGTIDGLFWGWLSWWIFMLILQKTEKLRRPRATDNCG